jgi:D-alanyl-D-alanine carboxypeptidase
MSAPETLSTQCFVESDAQTTPIGVMMATRILIYVPRIKACSPYHSLKMTCRLLKRRILNWRLDIGLPCVVLFALCTTALGQELLPPASPSPSPSPAEVSETARPLYGLQGVLVETLNGKVVSSQAENDQFNPASTLKLATSLVALQTLGPSHRFATGVWTDGAVDKTTGVLTGNLYISGRDPSFHYEHAVLLARELNSLGIKQVSGDLIVAPGFTMNFSPSASRSGGQLYDTLDSSLRYAEAVRAWSYERTLLNDRASLETVPSVAVMGDVSVGPVAPAAKLLLTQRSSKLVDILKVLLCYSNNFMAERIGDALGGPDAVRQRLVAELQLAPDELKISHLSGLGVNRASPRTMMKIYRALRLQLKKSGLTPAAIMPVAGIDPGTLEDRFTGMPWRGSVIAKTGTLLRTDGGASALVGQMRAANGEELLFVIMNQRGSVSRFRENQDYLVMLVQNTRGGPKAFDYEPPMLTMKLSQTESTVSDSEEFEPPMKSQQR